MGLFGKWKKEEKENAIQQLINEPYEQQYMEECKYIWKNYVPKNGQAKVLQGELLREIEKIRCEAQDNGNINWDTDYDYFCDFLKDTLSKQSFISDINKSNIALIMDYLKSCGNGGKLPYVDDNLYDIVADAIGLLHKNVGKPIPYERNNNLSR